jgi:hypothetical protein
LGGRGLAGGNTLCIHHSADWNASTQEGKSVFGTVVKGSNSANWCEPAGVMEHIEWIPRHTVRVERRGNKAGDRVDVGWQDEIPDVQIKQQNGSTHAALFCPGVKGSKINPFSCPVWRQ